MNVKNWAALALGVWGAALSGCKEDDPIPAITQASLLAGPANQSKTWKLTSGSVSFSGQPAIPFALDPCFGDNIYIFYNNASQDYEGQEGLSKCSVSDPTVIEKGSWFFSVDGMMVIISADETFSQNGLFSSLFGLTAPMKVVELTDTTMELEMTQVDGTDSIKYSFEFTKQ
jgi:hypothetical protein